MKLCSPELHWKHEQASCMLCEFIIDQYSIDGFSSKDIQKVKNMILGERPSRQNENCDLKRLGLYNSE